MREKQAKSIKNSLKLDCIISILNDNEQQQKQQYDNNNNDESGSNGNGSGVNNDKKPVEYTPLYSSHQDKVMVEESNDDNLKCNDISTN